MSDLIAQVALSALSCSAAIGLVLASRTMVARFFGAATAYALWALVPFAALAVLLPARSIVVVMHTGPQPITHFAPAPQTTASASTPLPLATGFDAWSGWAYLWIAGAIAAWTIFAWQQRRFVRGLGQMRELQNGVYRAEATHGCPVLVGIWRPRIVVPADFEIRYTARQRELILAHEGLHRARGDAALNALAALLRSVFWFDPLLHFALPYFLADQELACDAAVLARFPHARRAYADALIKAQLGGTRAALACHWRARNTLLDRVETMALPPVAPSRRRVGKVGVIATVGVATLAAWAAQPAHTEVRYEASADGETTIPRALQDERNIDTLAARPAENRSPGQSKPHLASTVRATSIERRLAERPKSPAPAAAKEHAATSALESRAADELSQRPTPAPSASKHAAEGSAIPTAGSDSPPRAIAAFRREHPPAYPAAAARTHLEGSVVLDVHVDENGRPLDARVARLEPPSANELASASLAAVTHWRFEPARRSGRAVDGHIDVPFTFALDGPSGYAAPESHRQASYRSFGAAGSAPDAAAPDAVVYVRVRIEDDGRVSASSIDHVDPASASGLGVAALAALKTWTFSPARERDKPVASTALVPVVFGTDARATPPIAHLRNLLDPVRVTPTRS